MRIGRLRLRNVKRHAELDLELAPGLTIIRGPNEAGKTTVQRALEMVLFRRANSTAQELDGFRTWGAKTEPWVGISFEDETGNGTLSKSFAGQRGTVELRLATGEVVSDPAAVEQRVASLTGLPSEKFFQATASVHHHELDDLEVDEATLRDRLQQSMSGADRGTHATRRKLEEAIRRYKTEGPKNPGFLKVWRAEVDRLRDSVARGEAGLTQLENDRAVLTAARERRAELERELGEQRQGYEVAQRAVALAKRGEDAQRRYGLYRRATELRGEIDELEASHPSPVPLERLRAAVTNLRNLEYRLSEMRAERSAEMDVTGYQLVLPDPVWRPWRLIAAVLLVATILVIGAGIALDTAALTLFGGALAIAFLAAVFMYWLRRRKLDEVKQANMLRDAEVARRMAGRNQLADQVRQGEAERAQALASINRKDLVEADALLAAEIDHSAQIDTRQAEFRGMLGDEADRADMAELRDQAAAETDQCRHALAGLGEIGAAPEKHLAEFEAAMKRLTPEREAAMQAEAQAEARVEANGVDAEQVAAEGEELATASERLDSAERRLRIYEEVLSTLNAAEQATMKKAARFLEEQMAGDVERITGGRYRQLKVDETNLRFSVFSPELGDWVDAQRSLSQGTLDQLYLCARLGIVRQVTQPAFPPLILDDPFVTFDEERARRALELLRDVAAEHQIIYLTTSDRYDGLADKVVVLPGPDRGDESAAGDTGPRAGATATGTGTGATIPAGPGGTAAAAGRPTPKP